MDIKVDVEFSVAPDFILLNDVKEIAVKHLMVLQVTRYLGRNR